MLSVNHKPTPNAYCNCTWRHITASSLILLSLIVMADLVRGDDLTGLSQNDTKDVLAFSTPRHQTTGMSFLPLPGWSHVGNLAALPDKLQPMGKVAVLVTPPTPATASLTPPKETPAPAPASTAKIPTPPPETTPAFIAVSPFLQWIKTNPQAAATEARQQANSYHSPSATAPASSSTASTGSVGPTATGAVEDPYWLPPLIDSSESGLRSVAGSAAIYQTPQR